MLENHFRRFREASVFLSTFISHSLRIFPQSIKFFGTLIETKPPPNLQSSLSEQYWELVGADNATKQDVPSVILSHISEVFLQSKLCFLEKPVIYRVTMFNKNSDGSQKVSFTIPLGTKAHEIGRQSSEAVCNTGKDANKTERVYLNSLAVYAVNYYLEILRFETEFEQSNSQDKLMLKFFAQADLPVKNIGVLECIPVLNDAEYCDIPLEVWSNRIGYVVVQLSASLKEAVILGFTKTGASQVALNELLSVDDLIDYLTDLSEGATINIS
ncbi:DUF1822 family protein [Dulcicalothrix desertica]|uniref:DUF1822 family protein n=1 Tax=Dulcicalothrix desertica TaxID=32056 RepID=UPI00191EC78B|nr:DUF1822 family protein [Dulcicalothrix desertica]